MGGDRRVYTLLGADGRLYSSDVPGLLGGHRRLKVYGRLDCPSALRAIGQCRVGQTGGYLKYRVFFASETVAIAAGYRPCGACLPVKYQAWREARSAGDRAQGGRVWEEQLGEPVVEGRPVGKLSDETQPDETQSVGKRSVGERSVGEDRVGKDPAGGERQERPE
ncbi:hypothetical protein [Kineosporia sp. NBRC 101731]|uniref:hypothetical protein n=1 Tax=Kineosporia sp. NBRC 101731 TaxID=3032199 RepID=UPI0024A3492B|nr:hypothetical protein [Kineosporia sp. NBRC 101731]GLY30521.1 hypothetical protein Kisp02_38860 [Kineosporia sp. NBRC 101731]